MTEADLVLLADVSDRIIALESEAASPETPEWSRKMIDEVRLPVLRKARSKFARDCGLLL